MTLKKIARSKADMVADMRDKSNDIRKFFSWAHIEDHYLHIPENAARYPMKFIRPGYKWLCDIFTNQLDEVIEIWRKLPESNWELAKALNRTETREFKILRARLAHLRAVVIAKNRPDFFKKTMIAKQEKVLNANEKVVTDYPT